jgi:hypothetical protein
LNSETAIEVNIQIIRIFTRIREVLLTHKDLLLKMEQLEKKILQQDEKTNKHEEEIQLIFNALKQLLNPPQEPRTAVGFKTGSNTKENYLPENYSCLSFALVIVSRSQNVTLNSST